MSENLWKKEESRIVIIKNMYVDLFKSLNPIYFCKLNEQLDALKLKRNDVLTKCNEKSKTFLNQGHQFYKNFEYYRAIDSFTKALRFAEIDTQNVSLALLNRAKCFNKLKMNYHALNDIKLEMEFQRSEDLVPMLDDLRNEYQISVEDISDCRSNKQLPSKLDFESDENFPCLANVLQIQWNTQFGRHITAKCDIDVGQIVLMEESFASVNRSNEHVCYTCLADTQNGIPCSKCTDVVFCSIKCMESNEVHKMDCQTMYHGMPHKVQFTIHTILVAVTTFPDIDSLMAFVENSVACDDLPDSVSNDIKSKYCLYLKLEKSFLNEDAISDVYDLFKLTMTIPMIKELFNTERKQRFLAHLLLHHLAVNVNNRYDSETTTSIGATLCLFNHSCVPNLYNYATGNQTFCITIRPVKKNEQLFISYLGKSKEQSGKERQTELKLRWNFECKCDRCEPQRQRQQIDSNKMRQDSNYKFIYRHFKIDSTNVMNTTILKKKCIKFLQKYGHLPFSNELDFISNAYTTLILKQNILE